LENTPPAVVSSKLHVKDPVKEIVDPSVKVPFPIHHILELSPVLHFRIYRTLEFRINLRMLYLASM
jgi:hypothetical protein